MLKEPMRLRSTVLRKESRLCGPSFLMVRSDTAACGGHRDVETAEPVDRLLQHLLGAYEVGDVHLVERAADGVRHLAPFGLRPVQHRDARATLGQRLRGRPSEARRSTDDDGLLALDLHLAPFQRLRWTAKQDISSPIR